MLRNNLNHKHLQNPWTYRQKNKINQLGIEKVDFIKDKYKKHLILLLTGNQMVYSDIYAFLKGTKLILEAPIAFDSGEFPVRTHLVGEEAIHEYLEGDQDIGFSEIDLNSGFHYSVLSSTVLTPGFFKIVLTYRPLTQHNKSIQIN